MVERRLAVTPAATSAGALLILLAVSGALSAYRRHRAVRRGEAHPQAVFLGLRWAAAVRAFAVATSIVFMTLITLANPEPLVNRLFPGAGDIDRAHIVLAFREVLAIVVVGVAAFAALADGAVTFVRHAPLRRALMAIFSIALACCTAYGGLFVFALAIS